jgi:diphthamide biosynthesis enzyme Dph1/Dph2-like protein
VEENYETVFEVERCVGWIEENRLENVTLQFPDELLPYSAKVALAIEKKIGKRYNFFGSN